MTKASRQEFGAMRPCRNFSPPLKNESQKLAWKEWPNADIMFLTGPAGTGKTHVAAVLAMKHIYDGNATKIILVRPAVEAEGEDLGYLPGEIGDKLGPYLKPVKEEVEKICLMTGAQAPEMEMVPIAYMRGRNFDDCVIIVDEAQNMNKGQFGLVFSRMCKQAKMVVSGDPVQVDIHDSFLERAVDSTAGLEGVIAISFSEKENVRHGLVPKVLKRFQHA